VDTYSEASVLRVSLFRICALLAVFLLLSGCRTATPSQASSPLPPATAPQSTPRTSADVLGRVELQSASVANAFEAVMRFRPQFLKRRMDWPAGEGTDGAVVYLDGVKQGGTEMLRSIPILPIYEIRYFSATAASALFGPFYPAGVIAVRTRPGTQ
jgi:hypothetical protein